MADGKKLLIIDTDCGVDDAEALLMALSRCAEHVDVVAVTCVAGNATLTNVTGNVLRVLKIAGREGKVDVYAGCDSFLLDTQANKASTVHGADGFGGIAHTISVDMSQIREEHAVLALIRLVKERPGQLSLVTLGPLTNVALAQKLWPSFSANLKEHYIMGGNISGVGNVTASAEFNFFCDPEAASIVINEFACPKTLISWETCTTNYLPWEWYRQWLSVNSTKAAFLQKLHVEALPRRFLSLSVELRDAGYHACDLLAMAVFVEPSLVLDSQRVHATVELAGQWTRAQVVIDWRQGAPAPNLTIVRKVDIEKLKRVYEKMLL